MSNKFKNIFEAISDGKKIMFRSTSCSSREWKVLNPETDGFLEAVSSLMRLDELNYEFMIRTDFIELSGCIIPAPMNMIPEQGMLVYIIDLSLDQPQECHFNSGLKTHMNCFIRGLIYSDIQMAVIAQNTILEKLADVKSVKDR